MIDLGFGTIGDVHYLSTFEYSAAKNACHALIFFGAY